MEQQNTGDVGNLIQTNEFRGNINYFHATDSLPPNSSFPARPTQLPPNPKTFVDRVEAQSQLGRMLEESTVPDRAACAVISGPNGVGRAALARRWLYQVVSRFADGQIYFDFHARRSAGIADVVTHCLRALGVHGENVPATVDDGIDLLRTLCRERELAFFFDNVRDPGELLRLLPASAGCLVLMTSQRNARELLQHGVVLVELPHLPAESAVELLAQGCGLDRVTAEPDAAAHIVELCGRLPITLRIVAGRLALRPKWSLSRVAAELAGRDAPLEWFARNGDSVVHNALNFAYENLPEHEARLYTYLGFFPGDAFSVRAVAALANLTFEEAEERLCDLCTSNLLEENDQDQYRFHSLVQSHAGVLAAEQLPEQAKNAALSRLVDWYWRYGAFADRMVTEPARFRVGADEHLVEGRQNPFTTVSQAMRWLEQERLNILAVVEESANRGWHSVVVSLCDGPLWALHLQHKNYSDMESALSFAIESARTEGNQVARARMLSLRARVSLERHEWDRASDDALCARQVAEESGHRRVLASTLEFDGQVSLACERFREAIERFTQAREINEEIGRPRGMALQEYMIGRAHYGLCEYDEALQVSRIALRRMEAFPADLRTPSRIRVSLGRIHQRLGNDADAIAELRAAISLTRQREASFDLAEPLRLLADLLDATGDPAAARSCREEALAIYEQSHSPEAEGLRQRL